MNREQFKKQYDFDANFDGLKSVESSSLQYWSRHEELPSRLQNITHTATRHIEREEKILDHQFAWRKFDRSIYITDFQVECQLCLWCDGVLKEKLFIFIEDGVITIKTPPSHDLKNSYLMESQDGRIIYNPENIS